MSAILLVLGEDPEMEPFFVEEAERFRKQGARISPDDVKVMYAHLLVEAESLHPQPAQ